MTDPLPKAGKGRKIIQERQINFLRLVYNLALKRIPKSGKQFSERMRAKTKD